MKWPEKYRKQLPPYESEAGEPGLFFIPGGDLQRKLMFIVVASNEMGWDHVSVSIHGKIERCPTWEEMCRIKDMFFEKDETVVQMHPPESEYVNQHKHCLHMWKKQGFEYPLPPSIMVGVKS